MTRRDLLIGGAAAATLAGCADVSRRLSPEGAAAVRPKRDVKPVRRVADRVGFGATGNQLSDMESMGSEKWIERQIAADLPEDPRLILQTRRLATTELHEGDARDYPQNYILRELQAFAILKAVYSSNQLFERMVDFWSNHLNVYGRKGLAAYRIGRDGREVVRAHAMGSFRDLIMGSAKSPAMLMYLDNHFNRKDAPNENYAREIMELHTLGVHGGYSQKDVMEVARCFTGWGIETGFMRRRGAFAYRDELHDKGEKIVLGQKISSGGGLDDGERVVDIVCSHPATANHIARKLTRHFRGDEDEKWVAKVESAFAKSKGDVRETLRPLLNEAGLDGPPMVKRPFDYMVSSIRAVGAQTDGGPGLQRRLEEMGQPLFQWPMPDGYPVDADAWTGTLLARWNFALDLCHDRIEGTRGEFEDLDANESILMRDGKAGEKQTGRRTAALALLSPEFMWR